MNLKCSPCKLSEKASTFNFTLGRNNIVFRILNHRFRVEHRHSDIAARIRMAVYAGVRRRVAAMLLPLRWPRGAVVHSVDVPCLRHAAVASQDMPEGGGLYHLVHRASGRYTRGLISNRVLNRVRIANAVKHV